MPLKVFEKVLDYPFLWKVVCGHHFGEPLLHPHIMEIAALCRQCGLGFGFSTNAEKLDIGKFTGLLQAGLTWLKISFHSPHGLAIYDKLKKLFPDFLLLASELDNKHDWAGQVRGIKDSIPGSHSGDCIFHAYNLSVVSAQAEVLACCMDAHGASSIGSIFQWNTEEFSQLKNDTNKTK